MRFIMPILTIVITLILSSNAFSFSSAGNLPNKPDQNTKKCVVAYQHAHFKGNQWNFCPGKENNTSKWEGKISSIKVMPGYKAILCRDKNKYGDPESLCREYNKSEAWVGDAVNDKYEYIKVLNDNDNSFHLIIASDTQYKYCVSSACKNGPGNSYIANKWHSESMKKLSNHIGKDKFSGVIVNGDLTNTMDREDIIQFEKDYSGLPVYPGLGNHDYENYIGDKACDGSYIESGGYRAWASNLCAARLVHWFVGRADTIPNSENDIKVSGHRGKNIDGSLSYSFDKKNWHFIQLNNHPAYATSFKSYDSWIVRVRNINITRSYQWLENDLNNNKEKLTVLNYHIFNPNDDKLKEILDYNPQVKAIFAGHLHKRIGSGYINDSGDFNNQNYSIKKSNGEKIPVYFSGSAENNIYLHVIFNKNSLTVKPVSSLNGNYKYIDLR